MERDSFIFYRSFYECINELPVKNQFELYKAIIKFSLDGEEIELKGLDKSIFALIKPQLEANNRRYENGKCEKKKGKSKADGEQDTSETEARPKQDRSKTEAKTDQTTSKTEANNNDNVNDNVNDNDNVNVNGGGAENDSIFSLLDIEILAEDNAPTFYKRYINKPSSFNGSKNLSDMVTAVQQQYNLDDLKKLFIHAEKTYWAEIKYLNCDLVWIINNAKKVLATAESETAKQEPKKEQQPLKAPYRDEMGILQL